MDEQRSTNFIELRGALAGAPVFSHMSRGERFFTFPVESARLSGAVDTVNVIARESLVSQELADAGKLYISGELRSFNNKRGEGARLVISVFARELSFSDGPDVNSVSLTGALCKAPTLRSTPMGRDICDMMLAVSRKYGRSDYLPCICWGARAREASLLSVGDRLSLTGRMQSREYIKLIDGEPTYKTAYEVSVTDMSTSFYDSDGVIK